jgi:hypothetical protein
MSFQVERREFNWTDFHEISYMSLLLRAVCTDTSPLKSHTNNGHSVLCEVRAEAEKITVRSKPNDLLLVTASLNEQQVNKIEQFRQINA